jgi:membrane-bound lytic murein transglycosylase D
VLKRSASDAGSQSFNDGPHNQHKSGFNRNVKKRNETVIGDLNSYIATSHIINVSLLRNLENQKPKNALFMYKKLTMMIIAGVLGSSVANAQQNGYINSTDQRLEYIEPVQLKQAPSISRSEPVGIDELERDLMLNLADIYRQHVLALDAQVNGDLVSAEKYIIDALTSFQGILEENPEVQSNRRVAELYRTLIAEYQAFYGITDPIGEPEGDIFAALNEMFNLSDDFVDSEYFVLPEHITVNKTQVPLILNRQVQNQIAFLAYRRPDTMARWLERSAVYFPMMRQIFQEEGVPLELIHLSMVESGLVPVAASRARAVGLWQFIQSTGAMYGLEVNWWIDERRDPVKSTRAAARHLKDLYEYWNDWHLALANYNVSTRRMRQSIQLAGGQRDYWAIFPYLPRETRGYVPIYIAATLIATNPQDFGFEPKYDAQPYAFDVVEIEGSVDLNILAEAAGITTQELKSLNPELLRWATPPGKAPYPLKIPSGTKDSFVENYKNIPESARKELLVHTVSRGESLGVIANRYSVTVRDIYAANERLTTTIHPGQEIIIPVPQGSNVAISANMPSRARNAATSGTSGTSGTRSTSANSTTATNVVAPPNTARVTYTVKSGDTIGHISEWFETDSFRIRGWNNTSNSIRVGQRLALFVPASRLDEFERINSMSFNEKQSMVRNRRSGGGSGAVASNTTSGSATYTVQRNDNLSSIARAHGTTVQQLRQLNNLRNDRINVGQVLRVR